MQFCGFDSRALSLPVNCGSCDCFAREFAIWSDSDIDFYLKQRIYMARKPLKNWNQVVSRKSLYTENHFIHPPLLF